MLLFRLLEITFTLYISYRLYKSFFQKYKLIIILPLLMIVTNFFAVIRIFNKTTGILIPDIISFISNVILALCVYIFFLYIIIDIVKVIFKILHKKYINNHIQGIIAVSISIIVCFLGYINSHITNIKEYNITLNKTLYSPLKIVALADIHIGADMSSRRLGKEIQIINDLNADIIFIVGDIIDNNINDFTNKHIEQFQKLNAPLGVYVVLGNHEYYSGNKDEILSVFNKAGFKTLIDDVAYISEKDFYIIGRDSLLHTNDNSNKRQNIQALYEKIEDKTKPIIILDHIPISSLDGRNINADIQISGHTHDGQFFPINIIVRKMYELASGMIKYDGFHFFVTSGLGLWGPPMRVGTDSEILLINVINQ